MPPYGRLRGAKRKNTVTPYNKLDPLSKGLLHAGSAAQKGIQGVARAASSSVAGKVAKSAYNVAGKGIVNTFEAMNKFTKAIQAKPKRSPGKGSRYPRGGGRFNK